MFEKFKNELKYLNPDKVFKNNCAIVEINGDADILMDALGITPDRHKHLVKLVEDGIESTKSTVECGVKVSQHCLHPNELFFVAQMICEIHVRRSMGSDLIEGLMKRLGKNREDNPFG